MHLYRQARHPETNFLLSLNSDPGFRPGISRDWRVVVFVIRKFFIFIKLIYARPGGYRFITGTGPRIVSSKIKNCKHRLMTIYPPRNRSQIKTNY